MVESRSDREEAMLAEARAEVGYADHKASLVLASLGIGFGAALGGLLAGDWKPSDQDVGEVAWWVAAVLAAIAVFLAAAAVWPRFTTRTPDTVGVTYWGDVATFASYDAFDDHLAEHPDAMEKRTRQQLWHLARLVHRKYTLVRWSFGTAALAVIVFAVSALQAI